jgi:type I restriction enzyme S subunit
LEVRAERSAFGASENPANEIQQALVKLYSTIQNLRRTRDLLLPRLLSGQIDVETLPQPDLSDV